MMQDEEIFASRLREIMDAITRTLESEGDGSSVVNLAKRRSEIEKAAMLLVANYGAGAPERARKLEERQPNSRFAQSVRVAVEKIVAERSRG